MTEKSRFWNGIVTGDASEAPYDAPTEFGGVAMSTSQAWAMTDKGGIYVDNLSDFAISSTGANNQRVASGRGEVYGTWYQSDANTDVTIPTPSVSTRVDRIVLRKDWSAQTVRIVRIAGTEGAGTPALTQSVGVTWDTPLYLVSITTGGTMTVTDQRDVINGLYGAGVRVRPTGSAIGIGMVPSAWDAGFPAIQMNGMSLTANAGSGLDAILSANSYVYNSGGATKAVVNGFGTRVLLSNGTLSVGIAANAVAEAVQTWTSKFDVDSNGLLVAGTNGVVPAAGQSRIAGTQLSLANTVANYLNVGVGGLGILMLSDGGGRHAIFTVNSGSHTTTEIADPSGIFVNTAPGGGQWGIYWNGAGYVAHNGTGGTQSIQCTFIGI